MWVLEETRMCIFVVGGSDVPTFHWHMMYV